MEKPALLKSYPNSMRLPYGPYMGVVDRVVDGDTLIVCINAGLKLYPCVSIRLKDVMASELDVADGSDWADYLGLLAPQGTPVKVYISGTTYERFEGTLILQNGRSINSLMNEWGDFNAKK